MISDTDIFIIVLASRAEHLLRQRNMHGINISAYCLTIYGNIYRDRLFFCWLDFAIRMPWLKFIIKQLDLYVYRTFFAPQSEATQIICYDLESFNKSVFNTFNTIRNCRICRGEDHETKLIGHHHIMFTLLCRLRSWSKFRAKFNSCSQALPVGRHSIFKTLYKFQLKDTGKRVNIHELHTGTPKDFP